VSAEAVPATLQSLLKDQATRQTMGQNGLQLMERNRGAISRTLSALQKTASSKS
jgi:3-deoxy-D-manno-octulosonic-acid transferase